MSKENMAGLSWLIAQVMLGVNAYLIQQKYGGAEAFAVWAVTCMLADIRLKLELRS